MIKGKSIVICRNCGNEIPDGEYEFCPICGSKTDKDIKENKRAYRAIRIAVIFILIILILLNLMISLVPLFFYKS